MDMYSAINSSRNYLLSTPEFAALKSAASALKRNSKASTLVNQFHKKEESIYSSHQSNSSQLPYLMEDLNKDYEKLMTIPEIRSYFIASENFNNVISNYMRELNQSLQKELA